MTETERRQDHSTSAKVSSEKRDLDFLHPSFVDSADVNRSLIDQATILFMPRPALAVDVKFPNNTQLVIERNPESLQALVPLMPSIKYSRKERDDRPKTCL